jgi:hypothetical protein
MRARRSSRWICASSTRSPRANVKAFFLDVLPRTPTRHAMPRGERPAQWPRRPHASDYRAYLPGQLTELPARQRGVGQDRPSERGLGASGSLLAKASGPARRPTSLFVPRRRQRLQRQLGWSDVQVIDDDLGRSGGGITARLPNSGLRNRRECQLGVHPGRQAPG